MMKYGLLLVSALCVLFSASAFTTTAPAGLSIKTAKRAPGLKPTYAKQTLLRMSEDNTSTESEEKSTEVAPKSGEAFYDDEVS